MMYRVISAVFVNKIAPTHVMVVVYKYAYISIERVKTDPGQKIGIEGDNWEHNLQQDHKLHIVITLFNKKKEFYSLFLI